MALSERLRGAMEGVRELGFAGERRALALLPLVAFGLLYLVLSLNAQPGWGPALMGLSLAYMIGFFALAAGWFWARWFASGLGWSGFMVGVMAIVLFGWIPALGIYTGMHGLIVALLMGPKMAARYELQPGWQQRYDMDEFGVARLGKAVTRGASALPTLILWALGPREEALFRVVGPTEGLALGAGLALLVLGLYGLVKQRAFAVLALGGAALAVAVGTGATFVGISAMPGFELAAPVAGWVAPWTAPLTLWPTLSLALVLLTASFSPWALPLVRFVRRR
jgi:hypothetical protein